MSSATWRILTGDCRDLLRELPDESVNCVVTSPPYFGLRDYGTAEWAGGDPGCDHAYRKAGGTSSSGLSGGTNTLTQAQIAQKVAVRQQQCRDTCRTCGATRVDSQIGLEPTVDEFVQAIVEVFREVRRVLRDDGVVWLNLGDSYAGGGGYAGDSAPSNARRQAGLLHGEDRDGAFVVRGSHNYEPRTKKRAGHTPPGTKRKDLLLVPPQVALALRDDGWYLRSEVIWAKPNPLPESVDDRPTRAHEQVYLLSKRPTYYYDAFLIREQSPPDEQARTDARQPSLRDELRLSNGYAGKARPQARGGGRNKRGVWEVPDELWAQFLRWVDEQPADSAADVWRRSLQGYGGAHFATFPIRLIEPCILAGCPERTCAACGEPHVRRLEKRLVPTAKAAKTFIVDERDAGADGNDAGSNRQKDGHRPGWIRADVDLGLFATCDCDAGVVPGVVLDPFCGAATTILTSLRRGRSAIGLELNPEYAAQGRQRVLDDAPLLNMPAEQP